MYDRGRSPGGGAAASRACSIRDQIQSLSTNAEPARNKGAIRPYEPLWRRRNIHASDRSSDQAQEANSPDRRPRLSDHPKTRATWLRFAKNLDDRRTAVYGFPLTLLPIRHLAAASWAPLVQRRDYRTCGALAVMRRVRGSSLGACWSDDGLSAYGFLVGQHVHPSSAPHKNAVAPPRCPGVGVLTRSLCGQARSAYGPADESQGCHVGRGVAPLHGLR